ncbi:MAG: cupin domain-containing protein [Ruoffia tabacinasalis]
MQKKQTWIDYYNMEAHPEGGYFHQVLKSDETFKRENQSPTALYTTIYFLLTDSNPSRFHRLTSDEIWYYHYGNPLTVHMITPEGEYQKVYLGTDIEKGQVLQAVVPKNTFFGSTVEEKDGYSLVGCMVSPGFKFEDFELFERQVLLEQYPKHTEIITRLTTEKNN